eukprot:gb/GECG01013923.1/.p1 GENE.gb/GECG01013923.1/~~gb/GECG01013923.1/.p1  ORF type:complete len:136 (+),score=16.21 gb/GECG01013923.1/:1-408(+)
MSLRSSRKSCGNKWQISLVLISRKLWILRRARTAARGSSITSAPGLDQSKVEQECSLWMKTQVGGRKRQMERRRKVRSRRRNILYSKSLAKSETALKEGSGADEITQRVPEVEAADIERGKSGMHPDRCTKLPPR